MPWSVYDPSMHGAATHWSASASVVQPIESGYVVVVRWTEGESLRKAVLLSRKKRARSDEAHSRTYCSAGRGGSERQDSAHPGSGR